MRACCTAGIALVGLGVVEGSFAAPPEGHFGPVAQTYAVPNGASRVWHVAPEGDRASDGRRVDGPTTIEHAVAAARTGDVIILRGGTYRTGDLVTNQGISLQPYGDERPVLKGTRVATEWQPVRGGLWRTRWETLFPAAPAAWWRRESEITRTPLHKFNNDMVFVDGRALAPAGGPGEVTRDTFWVDYAAGHVYIGMDPRERLVEITAYDGALLRTIGPLNGVAADQAGLTVLGVDFSQYAFRAIEIEANDPEGPSDDGSHGGDVVGSRFEDCSFTHCSRVAGYFRGDNLVIRRCLVSDTGTEGIFVLASDDAVLERNIVTRNNVRGITGYFVSAVKIFNQCHRLVCRENLIVEHFGESSGVWYDVGNVDGVFVDNWVERTDNGFFFEISKGAVVAGNVFLDCPTGVKLLNSRDVTVANNTLINSRVHAHRNERSAENDHFGWHPASGPGVAERVGHEVVGNLFYADDSFGEPFIVVDENSAIGEAAETSQLATVSHNVFVRSTPAGQRALLSEPGGSAAEPPRVAFTLEQLEAGGRSGGSWASLGDRSRVFVGVHLRRFEPVSSFDGLAVRPPAPARAVRDLGWSVDGLGHPGAYAPR